MRFNEKIIMLRKNRNLSQDELGYKLGVARQTVSKWELGETTPEMDKLVKMSEFFKISLDELIKDTESNIETKENTSNTNNTNTQKLAGLTIKIIKGIGIFIVITVIAWIVITALSIISFGSKKTTTIEYEETEMNLDVNE